MVDNTKSAWDTETGLTENFVLTVEESWFATDARYNNGETLLLNWKGTAVDADTGEQVLFGKDEDETEFEYRIPCGKGWVSNDGGKTADHESGRAKGFNKSSIYGRIIDRALAKDGLNIGHILQSRGGNLGPRDASVWTGLKFVMKYEEISFGAGLEARSRLMPVSFVGEADGAAGGSSTTPAATTEQGGTTPANTVLVTRLRALAKSASNHSEFVDKALEIDGVADDSALLESVVDETKFYSEARS